jgi:hypothetical protein
VQFFDHHLPF